MISCRRIVATFVFILFTAPFVYSDILPISELNIECSNSADTLPCHLAAQSAESSNPHNSPLIAELDLLSIEFPMGANSDVINYAAPETIAPIITSDRIDSLHLCLSALISLGLCSSVHWMKKHSFGFIPEWYHNGGPFQIGHSHALMPGTLCPAPACCFIQPSCEEDKHLPQYFIKTVKSLWRPAALRTCHKKILSLVLFKCEKGLRTEDLLGRTKK